MLDTQAAYITSTYTELTDTVPAYIVTIGEDSSLKDCYLVAQEETPVDNSALRFVAADEQWVLVENHDAYNNMDTMTINMWLRTSGAGASDQGVAGKTQSWYITKESDGNWGVAVATASDTTLTLVSAPFTANRWQMVTLRYTGAAIKLYIDAVEVASTAKSGTVRVNSNAIALGWADGKGHADIDIASFELHNNDVGEAIIEGWYEPPNQCAHVSAFISADAYDTESSQTAVVVSYASMTNPYYQTATQLCAISQATVGDTQPAYISAGEDGDVTFDNRIDIENTYVATFDNVVLVRGIGTVIHDRTLGSIVYPITREVTERPVFATDYRPHKARVSLGCHIHAGIELSSSQGTFINAATPVFNNLSAYLHSYANSSMTAKMCYIFSNESSSSLGCYLDGYENWNARASRMAYIANEQQEQSSVECYIAGGGTEELDQLCYVTAVKMVGDTHPAYINSIAYEIESNTRRSFVLGHHSIDGDASCFIEGIYTITADQDAFIRVAEVATDSQPAYISTASYFIKRKYAYIVASGTMTDNNMCYITSGVYVDDTEPAYIAGYGKRQIQKMVYLVAVEGTGHTDSQLGFIVSDGLSASHNAFIVTSFAEEPQDCYLHCIGNKTRTKMAYITSQVMLDSQVAYIRA